MGLPPLVQSVAVERQREGIRSLQRAAEDMTRATAAQPSALSNTDNTQPPAAARAKKQSPRAPRQVRQPRYGRCGGNMVLPGAS